MSIAIVGPGGFIGTRLCAHLESRGIAYTTHSSRDGTGIASTTGLWQRRNYVAPGTQALVYLAQSPYTNSQATDYPHAFNVNALSAQEVALEAAARRVRRFVYVSAANVYAPAFGPLCEQGSPCGPDSLYAATKLCGEMLARATCGDRTDFTALRLFGVYGPGQTTRLMALLRDRVATGAPVSVQRGQDGQRDGGLRMSWVHVDDVCAAIEHAALHLCSDLPDAINVAGPGAYSITSTAELLGRELGRKPVFEDTGTRRGRDFIADTRLQDIYLGGPFRDLSTGLPSCIDHQEEPPHEQVSGF